MRPKEVARRCACFGLVTEITKSQDMKFAIATILAESVILLAWLGSSKRKASSKISEGPRNPANSCRVPRRLPKQSNGLIEDWQQERIGRESTKEFANANDEPRFMRRRK